MNDVIDDDAGTAGDSEIEKILRRVRLLLRKAQGRGTTPEEAASFAAKAQALMFKYNLDQARISLDDDTQTGPKIEDLRYRLGAKAGDVNWRKGLLSNICYCNFAHAVFTRDSIKKAGDTRFRPGPWYANIIATPENRQLVLELYSWLGSEIDRMSKQAWQTFRRYNPRTPLHWLTWQNSYKLGAVDTIIQRLLKQRREDEAAAGSDSRALIVLTDQAIEAVVKQNWPNVETVRHDEGANKYQVAYDAGQREAEGIPLKPVKLLDGGEE